MARPPAARPIEGEAISRALGLAVLGLSIVAITSAGRRARRSRCGRTYLDNERFGTAARAAPPRGPVAGLRGSAALLGLSVFVDSAIEHSRGRYRNRGMYAPVGVSALLVVSNVKGMASGDRRLGARDTMNATAVALSGAGLGFHSWNLLHRPGGLSWHNLFYAAPVGAPAALALSGLIGLASDHIRVTPEGRATLAGLPAGRVLAALAAAGLAGTAAEVTLLHFRGNFQSRYMWVPVALTPVAAVMLAASAARPSRERLRVTRVWLDLTILIGFAGVGFHARGISRMMGGWRNWSQNVIDGPPLPAPPSFAALAVAGLAALSLVENDHV